MVKRLRQCLPGSWSASGVAICSRAEGCLCTSHAKQITLRSRMIKLVFLFPKHALAYWGSYRLLKELRKRSAPSKLPKYIQCSRLCCGGCSRPRSFESIAIYRVPASAAVRCRALKVTKVSLFTVFPPVPQCGAAPSRLRRYRYLPCSRLCRGAVPHLQSYESIAIYCVPASAMVRCRALEVMRVSLFSVFPPLA